MTDEKETGDVSELVHSYTRREALDDGFLVNVSAMAREVGILYPVALTRGVYESYVVVPPKVSGQDLLGDCTTWFGCWPAQYGVNEMHRGPLRAVREERQSKCASRGFEGDLRSWR